MQSIIKNAGRAGFVVAMLVCASVMSGAHAEMTLDAKQTVELTKVDLFSLPDWKQQEHHHCYQRRYCVGRWGWQC